MTFIEGQGGDPFWKTPCPARTFGLPHTRSLLDPLKCSECGGALNRVAPMPPLDMEMRLRELGLAPEDARLIGHRENDDPMEPRYVTGHGPQGSEGGVGRGPVSMLDKGRLTFYCKVVRHVPDDAH